MFLMRMHPSRFFIVHKYHLFLFFKGAPHQPGGPNYHGHQQGPPMQGLMPGQGPMGRPPGHLGGNYFIYVF